MYFNYQLVLLCDCFIYSLYFVLYAGSLTDLHRLQKDTDKRKRQAFRPGTVSNHKTYIRTYLSFCAHFSLRDIDPTVNTMCLYVEFLARSFSSPKSIVNYIGGVRFLHKLLNVSSTALASFDLELMMRAINITMERKTPVRLPVTLEMLHALCEICDMLPPNGVVFKCVFLFAFAVRILYLPVMHLM